MITNTTMQAAPSFVPAGGGTAIELGDQHVKVAVSAKNSQNAFTLFILDAEPGACVPPHIHDREDETFYVLEGTWTVQVDGKVYEGKPGDTLYAPRRIVHTWTCETGGRVALLVTPGQSFETFFERMEQKIAVAQAENCANLGAVLGALAQEHGITMFPTEPPTIAPTGTPLYIPSGEGVQSNLGEHQVWTKIAPDQSETGFLLGYAYIEKNGGVPPHIHSREDGTFHVLEGRFLLQVGNDLIEAGPGDTLFAPRGIAHAFQCVSENGGWILDLVTPGDNFQAFGKAMAEQPQSASSDMANPSVLREFMALAERYGIEMLPPIK